jgi:hypothetical protein
MRAVAARIGMAGSFCAVLVGNERGSWAVEVVMGKMLWRFTECDVRFQGFISGDFLTSLRPSFALNTKFYASYAHGQLKTF